MIRDKETSTILHAVMALPKFFNSGDAVSFNAVEQNKDAKYHSSVYLNKCNGECTHLAAFEYNKEQFIVIGSKNVHLVVRNGHEKEDLSLYTKETRYSFAVEFAHVVLASIDKPGSKVRQQIIDRLVASGETWVGGTST